MAHTEIEIGASGIAENLLDFTWHLGTPAAGSILTFSGAQKAHTDQVNPFLNGHFAELTLSATHWLFRFARPFERIALPLRIFPESLRTGIFTLGERKSRRFDRAQPRTAIHKLLALLHVYLLNRRGIHRWCGIRLFPEQIESLFSPGIFRRDWKSPADLYRDIYRNSPSRGICERTTYAYMKAGMGINMPNNDESNAATYSVRLLTPLIDQQLLEFAQSIPFGIKTKGGSGKYIPRELCRRFVTSEYADLPKS